MLLVTKVDILDFSSLKPKHDLFLTPNRVVFVPKPNQILTRALSQHKIEKIKCKEAQGFNMSTCCLVLHLCLYNISEQAVGWSAGELAARMIWRSRQRQCRGSILISKNYSDYSH